MYTKVNPIKQLIEDANKFAITNDRQLYDDLLRKTEEHCYKNKYVIHNRNILLSKERDRDDFVYTIFFTGGFAAACELADTIFTAKVPHIPINTLSLSTLLRNKTFTILVNARPLLNLINVPNLHQILSKISIESSGFYGGKIYVSSALIHLCGSYEVMYGFAQYKKWEGEVEIERELFSRLDNAIEGAAEPQRQNDFIPIAKLTAKIVDNLDKLNCIVVGDYAYGETGRLQIITSMTPNELSRVVYDILSKERYDVGITESSFMFDSRLMKYTVKIGLGDKKYDLFDAFNNCAYEALTYVDRSGMRIGSPYVLARYALIQYYITDVILGADSRKRLGDFLRLRDGIQSTLSGSPEEIEQKLFNKKSIFGMNISEKVWNRQFMTERLPIYYPALAAKSGGATMEPRLGGKVVWYNHGHLKIAQKITQDYRSNINDILKTYYKSNVNMWASEDGKQRNPKRLTDLIKYCPKNATYLDIGSGDGIDFAHMSKIIGAKEAISSDIKNYLRIELGASQRFCEIAANTPLNIPDNSVDVITMFHSLHHCVDAKYRMNDIARMLKPCGILIIKDHDISSNKDAENVSLEHFVYSVGEGTATIDDVDRYQSIEPMYYFAYDEVRKYILSLGFSEKKYDPFNNPTKVYFAIFQKYDSQAKECLFKGETEPDLNII